eukprot:TRINITY_DN22038_c0_g1_i1.p1 TRINITY_DN22038_c0_g1~~TRINITY_DN22038_c0_g1_i1.p1  ORF type:complete len:245 (+),score=46.41 TRINITY_DN22038_c0_g1_i1:65-799(+)
MEAEGWFDLSLGNEFLQPECQYPALPTGCEATALTFLLRFLFNSNKFDKCEVAKGLIKELQPFNLTDAPASESNEETNEITMAGGNPNRGFIGDPFDPQAFGVFHTPIFEALQNYIGEADNHKTKYEAKDLTGSQSFDTIIKHLQTTKIPIVIWITLELKPSRVTDRWYDAKFYNENTKTDTKDIPVMEWRSPEHCVLFIGSNEKLGKVSILDPHTGRRDEHDLSLVQQRWTELGCQAVGVVPL